MRLHNSRLLVGESFFLGFAEFLHQSHGLHFEATGESSACSGVHDFHELFGGEIEELIKIDSSEHELPESSLLFQLHLCSFVSHFDFPVFR